MNAFANKVCYCLLMYLHQTTRIVQLVFGVEVTALVTSKKLSYVEPG